MKLILLVLFSAVGTLPSTAQSLRSAADYQKYLQGTWQSQGNTSIYLQFTGDNMVKYVDTQTGDTTRYTLQYNAVAKECLVGIAEYGQGYNYSIKKVSANKMLWRYSAEAVTVEYTRKKRDAE